MIGIAYNNTSMAISSSPIEEHGHHCDDDNCLMYHAVRTTDVMANLLGGDIPELDEKCLDDLAVNGGR